MTKKFDLGRLTLVAGALAFAIGCGAGDAKDANEESVGTAQQALTPAQARVLGFETPASDWSSTRPVSSSATASQGSAALAITPNGYVEVMSIALSSLGAVKSQVSFDLRLPQTLAWGEARLVVSIPSKGVNWQDLGGISLVGQAAASYKKLTFAVPAALETALEGSYTDLRLRVILNAPNTASPFLVDNFDIADTGGTPTPVPPNTLSFVYPRGQALSNVFMSASDRLQVDDRVSLPQPGKRPVVAGLGSSGVEVGAGGQVIGNLYSGGNVFLRSSSHTYGFITAAGVVTKQQADVLVDGLITQNTPVPVATTSIVVTFPPAGPVQTVGPDGPVVPLAPGSYAGLDVRPRGRVALRTGTYYFDSFNSEPEGEIQLNGAPIYIYVKSSFTYKGAFKRISGADAQVLVGYLGTGTPLLQAPFVGTIAAPNGSLELRRPDSGQHRGSFFGKSIQTFSDANVAFVPFNYAFVCPLGDRDADGTFDCDDECPRDPAKTTPGQCGCNVSDVDTDGDKVANCEDECPLDAAVQVKGTCGCPSSPAPNGTVCGDGICRGSKVCQAGMCGDPNACKPANGCVPKFFDSKWYWFCPGPTSYDQAKAACGSVKVALAQVDSDAENAFLAGGVSGNSYLGANDRGTSGQWRWQSLLSDAGDRFWNGGSSGRRYYTRYSAWGAGSPSGPHCATLAANGTWTSVDCSSSAGFICEVPASQGDEFEEKEHDKTCEILGIPCDDVTPADCTDNEADLFVNMSESALVASFKACDDACKDGKENTTACANACTGPATPPGPNDRCDDYDLGDTRACALKELVPALAKACDTDAECTALGTVCGYFFGNCPLSDREGKVDTCFARNPRPGTAGRGSGKVCGIPADGCPKVDDPTFPPRCNTTQICNIDPANEQTVVDAEGAGSDLSNTPFDAATTFGDPVPEPSLEDPYPADNNPCNGTCPVTEAHPWCKLGLQEQPQDRSEVKPEKHGRSDGPAISFDFDPRLRFDHNVTLGAFGVPKIDVTAEAGFSAGVTFDIANGGHVSVVDVMAGLHATECGIDSSTPLKVFDEDFLPVLLGEDNGDFPLPLHLPDEAGRKKCRDAIAKFEDVANRAKKAYRDATTLLKQYKKFVDTPSTADNFGKQLCNDLLAERPRGFPPGICGGESPEETINRFVDYYERTVIGFAGQEAMKGLADLVAPLADSIPKIPAKFTLYDFGRKEEVTVAQVQFFIGPIPVNLEILTTSDYGVSINGEAELHAGEVVANMFSLSKDSAAKPLAFVQAGGVPHAGVGLALFAGVGFSAGGLTAKIGVEAALQLGELWIPAYAGAGVGLGSELDHRKLSEDDDKLSTGADLLPSKRYSIDVRYSALLKTKMRNVLQGSINGALKVKFFWFSKTWRKTLLSFTGFCKGTEKDDIPTCDLSLISLGGTVDIASGSLPWATVRPEVSFPKLRKIDTVAAQGTGTIDKQVVGEFFYDSLCTCIDNTKPEEDRECFRNKDCCDATPKCFKPPSGGKSTCIDCRKKNESCNTVEECCGGSTGLCWKNNCESKHGCKGDCNVDSDCGPKLTCGTDKKCGGDGCVK